MNSAPPTLCDLRPPRAALFLAALIWAGCSDRAPAPATPAARPHPRIAEDASEAAACGKCHPQALADWQGSQHAHAMRPLSVRHDAAAFAPSRSFSSGSYSTFLASAHSGAFTFDVTHSNRPFGRFEADSVIGITPLIQYLVPFPGGRLQTIDPAYDPRSNEWFNVFGSEDRQPTEWGAWMNRGMNWNSQCAYCHMTAFERRYDLPSDSYASRWRFSGISCSQCHPLTPAPASNGCTAAVRLSTNIYVETCATCHSRREQMTERFSPGDRYDDHFRLVLADESRVFHADGQVADEDYEYNSFMMSRMGHKGVACLDCHNPHSGKLKLPIEGNAVCLQCHIPPGVRGAKPIDPVQHSFHSATNRGSLCVDCHMPLNRYMARDLRRDHGMTSPDPLLTQKLGIPNTCNRCHTTNTVEWSIGWVNQWYGTNMERRARARALVVAAAQAGDESCVTNLIPLARSEEIDGWRATLIALLRPWTERAEVAAFLRKSLADPSPRVRAAAVRTLAAQPGSYDVLKPLRADPSLLVRMDAVAGTLNPMEHDPASYGEFTNYLNFISDQPAGLLRQAQRALAEGHPQEAVTWAERAAKWDASPAGYLILSQILRAAERVPEAVTAAQRSCELDAASAESRYTLALLLAEAGRNSEARDSLAATVRLDPNFGRAWYNLGLAYAAADQLPEAVSALERAEGLMPGSTDAPYALATVFARMANFPGAREALQRTLAIEPEHAAARALLSRLNP